MCGALVYVSELSEQLNEWADSERMRGWHSERLWGVESSFTSNWRPTFFLCFLIFQIHRPPCAPRRMPSACIIWRTKKGMEFSLCLCRLIIVHVGCKHCNRRRSAAAAQRKMLGTWIHRDETFVEWVDRRVGGKFIVAYAGVMQRTHTRGRNAVCICQNRVISFLSMQRQRQRLLLFPIQPLCAHPPNNTTKKKCPEPSL